MFRSKQELRTEADLVKILLGYLVVCIILVLSLLACTSSNSSATSSTNYSQERVDTTIGGKIVFYQLEDNYLAITFEGGIKFTITKQSWDQTFQYSPIVSDNYYLKLHQTTVGSIYDVVSGR